MTINASASQIQTAFVTGATGLLGNNLVRLLVSRGVEVKALVRSREKAEKQFADLPVEYVMGDMTNAGGFASRLAGTDVVFHTAAYFRDSFQGGKHWKQLYKTNVRGTAELLSHAYRAGVRRFVHTSSVAVLNGAPGRLIAETMLRAAKDADDYYLSKILSDREVGGFLEKHPDMWAYMVLPGWMVGPGDAGPTSSGQVIMDFVKRKLPGVPPATFSVVDARDVAEAMWLPAGTGGGGERYLPAGRHMTMAELFQALEHVSDVRTPKLAVPIPLLYALGAINELWARVSGQPALLGLATARLMIHERNRTHFNHSKSEQELGVRFRAVEETLRDTIAWYQENGWLQGKTKQTEAGRAEGESTC